MNSSQHWPKSLESQFSTTFCNSWILAKAACRLARNGCAFLGIVGRVVHRSLKTNRGYLKILNKKNRQGTHSIRFVEVSGVPPLEWVFPGLQKHQKDHATIRCSPNRKNSVGWGRAAKRVNNTSKPVSCLAQLCSRHSRLQVLLVIYLKFPYNTAPWRLWRICCTRRIRRLPPILHKLQVKAFCLW